MARGDRRHRRCQDPLRGVPGGSAPGNPSGSLLRHRARFFTVPKQILADY